MLAYARAFETHAYLRIVSLAGGPGSRPCSTSPRGSARRKQGPIKVLGPLFFAVAFETQQLGSASGQAAVTAQVPKTRVSSVITLGSNLMITPLLALGVEPKAGSS